MKIIFSRICAALLGALTLILGLSVPASAASPAGSYYAGYSTPYSHSYTAAGAYWHIPHLNCLFSPEPRSGATQWVGLGGISDPHHPSTSLVQVGIVSGCVLGYQLNIPFWEVTPPQTQQQQDGFTIGDLLNTQTGDTMSGSVDYYGTRPGFSGQGWYHLAMDDLTTGWSFGRWFRTGDPSIPTTAEWIVEPGAKPKTQMQLPLADFGQITFIDASYSTLATHGIFLGSPGSVTPVTYNIVQFGHPLTFVLPPNQTGEFTINYIPPFFLHP